MDGWRISLAICTIDMYISAWARELNCRLCIGPNRIRLQRRPKVVRFDSGSLTELR